jgi:CheY-like chemotaxis protein
MSPDAAITHRARALIIDDEPGVRTVLRRYLTRRGWEVSEVTDGAEAIAHLAGTNERQRPDYDLVICDLRMPVCSGPEIFEWVALHRRDLVGRVVFSSGDVREPTVAAFLESTGAPILEKPFELAELARAITSVVSSRRSAA